MAMVHVAKKTALRAPRLAIRRLSDAGISLKASATYRGCGRGEEWMFTNQRFILATTIVVATLATACAGTEDWAELSPVAPSNTVQASASSSQAASEQALVCGPSGPGTRPGTPPPGGGRTGGPGGLGPGDKVTTPGAPAPGTATDGCLVGSGPSR